MATATANGVVALLSSILNMWLPGLSICLGICLLILAILLILSAAPIGGRSYKAGAALYIIGGLVTLPHGLLGVVAAMRALDRARLERASRPS